MSVRLSPSRPGFALPFALLLIGILSVSAATLLARGDTEGRVNRDREAQMDAFALAQAGLEMFAKNRRSYGFTSIPPAVSESARVNLTGGYADVVMRRVRDKTATSEALYLVRSRGVRQAGAMAWTPTASHTVAQYAFFREGSMQVLSAWTSLTGLRKNGGSGTISGYDACNPSGPHVSGVAVPDGAYVQNGGSLVPEGEPNDTLYMGTQEQMKDEVKIDWDGIVNHNAIVPDLVIPGDAWPSFSDPDYWPVIRINGNYSIPTSGRGTLIVTGNLTINGSLTWDGVVLVGGTLTSNGNNRVLGAAVTGLNVKLGMTVPINDVGNGNKVVQYDSCNVASALTRFASVLLVPNTWVDNWDNW